MHEVRMGSVPRSETLRHERLADQLLDSMQGYTRRQNTVAYDKRALVGLFEEWNDQVRTLEWKIGEAESVIVQQQRQIKYLEWRLTTQPWKRVWAYFSFILGMRQWPLSR